MTVYESIYLTNPNNNMECPLDELTNEIEGEGDISESVSFDSVIKAIENDDVEAQELIEDIPAMVTLLRIVHKQGFWRGVLFGREMITRIVDREKDK